MRTYLVQKTYKVQVFCKKRNVSLVFGHLPFEIEPKATVRSYFVLLLSAAVSQS